MKASTLYLGQMKLTEPFLIKETTDHSQPSKEAEAALECRRKTLPTTKEVAMARNLPNTASTDRTFQILWRT